MFKKSARFYDALYHFKDYGAAAAKLHQVIQDHDPNASTLLDVGCGTGQHLVFFREWYQVAGLDLSPELLAVARERCGDLPLHQGSMVDFELDRSFDVIVCLFSAIAYVRTLGLMEQAVLNMARHLRPGGLLMVEPWFSPETYWVGKLTANFADLPDLKIAWMYTSEREAGLSILDIHFLVGTPEGIEQFSERHELGLFTHEEHIAAFQKAGLDVRYDPVGFGRGMYLGVLAK